MKRSIISLQSFHQGVLPTSALLHLSFVCGCQGKTRLPLKELYLCLSCINKVSFKDCFFNFFSYCNIDLFRVHSSLSFNTGIESHYYHHNQDTEQLHHPPKSPFLNRFVGTPSLYLEPWHVVMFSTITASSYKQHYINATLHHFWDFFRQAKCLWSSCRWLHVSFNSLFYCLSAQHSIMWMEQFVYPLTSWRTPGLFPAWGNSELLAFVHRFHVNRVFISLGVRLLGHRKCLFKCVRNCHPVFTVAFPPAMYESPSCSTSLPTLCSKVFFIYFSDSKRM